MYDSTVAACEIHKAMSIIFWPNMYNLRHLFLKNIFSYLSRVPGPRRPRRVDPAAPPPPAGLAGGEEVPRSHRHATVRVLQRR